MKKISKNRWTALLKDLSHHHQFAKTSISRIDPDGRETFLYDDEPLVAIQLVKRKGKISECSVKIGQIENGAATVTQESLGGPSDILFESSAAEGIASLSIGNTDGYRLIIKILLDSNDVSYESMVKEMAYYLAETRRFKPGHEQEDWYIAEKLIKKMLLETKFQ